MTRMNRKGRNKSSRFVLLHTGVTNSEAFQSLSPEATRVLVLIWVRHNGSNNGRIAYSFREARNALRAGSRKVQNAFKELQARGFLVCRTNGSFNSKVRAGEGKASEWEITAEPCDGQPPKRLYAKWSEKQNAATEVVTAGNHSGIPSPKTTKEKH